MPKFPVAHSSGKGDIKEVTFYKDIGVNLEYFVDEVDINAIVSPTQKNKHNQKRKKRNRLEMTARKKTNENTSKIKKGIGWK